MKAIAFTAVLVAIMLFFGQLPPIHAQSQPKAAAQLQEQSQPAGEAYLSPKPGSSHNPAGTTIAIRYGDTLDIERFDPQLFHVIGTDSGLHSGAAFLSDDQKTVIFAPDRPFTLGETVSVGVDSWMTPLTGKSYAATGFTFSVEPTPSQAVASTTGQLVTQHSAPAQISTNRYATLPADFPTISVTVPASGTAPGLIFATNFGTGSDPSGYYLMILDNSGQPVYYQQMASNSRSLDFTPLPDGTLAYSDFASDAFYIMDNTYHVVNVIRPGNGFLALDEHDLQLLPNGHYLLLASEARIMDLSKVMPGGNPKASVTGQVIQELDKSNHVVFQWRALDYFAITDTTESLTTPQIDFTHANAVTLDTDGNILLSTRHLDEITKIDRSTGAIIWRMGGKNNQFTFSDAAGVTGSPNFYHQHDIRVLPNGHFTLFDNHNDQQPMVSRALEYVVDENARTATLVWTYQTTPNDYAIAMGNVQRLQNGNTFIGWGTDQSPEITEVAPGGTKAFEMSFGKPDVTYRAFRSPWHGYPTWAPALVAREANNALTLSMSWNGATEIASYRVYGGNTQPPATLVTEQAKNGFETTLTVADAQNAYCYYQVMPVDQNGNSTHLSPVVMNPAATNAACAPKSGAEIVP